MSSNQQTTITNTIISNALALCIASFSLAWMLRISLKESKKGKNNGDSDGNKDDVGNEVMDKSNKRIYYERVSLSRMPALKNDLILRAARGEKTERIPVWMMRQAGRYLPEFMEVRQYADFAEMCSNPELASLVSVQPLERFKTLDAVIVFSDILVIPVAMGMNMIMVPKEGPVFTNPLKTPADIDKILNLKPDIEKTLGYVFDAVNLTRVKVGGRVPVIGFSGAPLTLFYYMVGKSPLKMWLYTWPSETHRVLQALADIIVDYLVGKVLAGAQLLQVFESNAGDLTPEHFEEFSVPYLAQISTRVKAALEKIGTVPVVPMTVFAKGANHEGALESLTKKTRYDVISIDWNLQPSVARRRVDGSRISLQGNLDLGVLYAPIPVIQAQVKRMLEEFDISKGGYIANLGHGMLPDMDYRKAGAFILAVQEISKEMILNGSNRTKI